MTVNVREVSNKRSMVATLNSIRDRSSVEFVCYAEASNLDCKGTV